MSAVFYYDGECGFCVRLVRRLETRDRHRSTVWVAYQSLDAPPPGIPIEAMERAAYFVSDSGETSEGFFAIRSVLAAVGAFAPLRLLMSLPGAALIGPIVYRLVADNRRRIFSCADACDAGARIAASALMDHAQPVSRGETEKGR